MTQVETGTDLLNALHIPSKGKVYDLDAGRFPGMPLWPGHAPFNVLTYRSPRGIDVQKDQEWRGENEPHFGFISDMLIGTVHTGSHIDALSHITCGPDNHWYGPTPADEALGDFGPTKYDATEIPLIVSRGVLADVAGYLGVPHMDKGQPISLEQFQSTMQQQGSQLRRGDVLLVRTGYMSLFPDRERMAEAAGPGITLDVAEAALEAGVIAVGGDTESLEVQPSVDPKNPHPVHLRLLTENAVYIMESLYLEELAADKQYEFLFLCLPLKIKGATGSMIRPVAIV